MVSKRFFILISISLMLLSLFSFSAFALSFELEGFVGEGMVSLSGTRSNDNALSLTKNFANFVFVKKITDFYWEYSSMLGSQLTIKADFYLSDSRLDTSFNPVFEKHFSKKVSDDRYTYFLPIIELDAIGDFLKVDGAYESIYGGVLDMSFDITYLNFSRSIPSSVTLTDRVKLLGNVRTLIKDDPNLRFKKVVFSSNSNDVLFGTSEYDLTKNYVEIPAHDLVSEYTENIYVCLDQELPKGECDYIPAEDQCDSLQAYYLGYCCDGSTVSFGTYSSDNNAFCTEDKNGEGIWVLKDSLGQIFNLKDSSLVSYGSDFFVCGQIPSGLTNYNQLDDNSFFTVKLHEFYCKDKNIIECGGSNPLNSVNSVDTGYKLDLTTTIEGYDSYYCSDYLNQAGLVRLPDEGGILVTKWLHSLDDFSTGLACTDAGFVFTGTKCCGENGAGEFYNDSWSTTPRSQTPGVCWNSAYISDGTIFEDSSFLVYRGKAEVCNKPVSDCSHIFDDVDAENSALCTPLGWVKSAKENLENSVIKVTLWDSEDKFCCKQDECWDGTHCVSDGMSVGIDSDFYYCSAGSWIQGFSKSDWHDKKSGFCTLSSQCLVDPDFNMSLNDVDLYWNAEDKDKPMCINNNDYILDHYCLLGNWTSRTAFLAEQLYNIAKDQSSFSVYCGLPEKVLLDFDYSVDVEGEETEISDLLSDCRIEGTDVPCVNSICLAKFDNKVLLATSLNNDIDADNSFLYALSLDNDVCSSAQNNIFSKCGSNPVWYNVNLNSLIYSPLFTLPSLSSDLKIDFLKTKFKDIALYVSSLADNSYSFFRMPSFSNVFFSKSNNKEIFSFKEERRTLADIDYFGVDFKGLNFDQKSCLDLSKNFKGYSCTDQNIPQHFYLTAYNLTLSPRFPSNPLPTLTGFWDDLTAKVRLS